MPIMTNWKVEIQDGGCQRAGVNISACRHKQNFNSWSSGFSAITRNWDYPACILTPGFRINRNPIRVQFESGGKFAELNLLEKNTRPHREHPRSTHRYRIRTTWQSQEVEEKKPWVTNDILDLCNNRRSVKKRRKYDQVSPQHLTVNQQIRRRMKDAK